MGHRVLVYRGVVLALRQGPVRRFVAGGGLTPTLLSVTHWTLKRVRRLVKDSDGGY